jgi:hypothetical protein
MSVPLIEWLDRERRFRVSDAGARLLEKYDCPIGESRRRSLRGAPEADFPLAAPRSRAATQPSRSSRAATAPASRS